MLLNLFVTVAHAADPEMGFTLAEIWQTSGTIAKATIGLLVLMVLVCTYVTIERLIAFNRSRNQSMALAAEIVGPMKKGDVSAALAVARDERFEAAYLSNLLRSALKAIEERFDEHGLRNAERSLGKAIVEEQGKMRRGMAILATTGSTAPFIGLFGTVVGVINAFQGMATAGTGLGPISQGIAEALITTAIGIGVAVLGVWAFNYFNGRIEKVTDEMIASEVDFSDWATKILLDRSEEQAKASK